MIEKERRGDYLGKTVQVMLYSDQIICVILFLVACELWGTESLSKTKGGSTHN